MVNVSVMTNGPDSTAQKDFVIAGAPFTVPVITGRALVSWAGTENTARSVRLLC